MVLDMYSVMSLDGTFRHGFRQAFRRESEHMDRCVLRYSLTFTYVVFAADVRPACVRLETCVWTCVQKSVRACA